jgi:hypothetical protein
VEEKSELAVDVLLVARLEDHGKCSINNALSPVVFRPYWSSRTVQITSRHSKSSINTVLFRSRSKQIGRHFQEHPQSRF